MALCSAGVSTTFFLLARDERVFTKLRQSVLGTIGMETPTFDTLRSLSYLRNVFYESKLSVTPAFLRLSAQKTRWGSPNIKYPAMRVYPTVPLNARNANTDTYLPAGGGPDGKSSVFVAKGQKVVFSTWGSHRNPKNFGDDAHDFRPERWENMQGDTTGYIPFNLGPRACPGRTSNTQSLSPPSSIWSFIARLTYYLTPFHFLRALRTHGGFVCYRPPPPNLFSCRESRRAKLDGASGPGPFK